MPGDAGTGNLCHTESVLKVLEWLLGFCRAGVLGGPKLRTILQGAMDVTAERIVLFIDTRLQLKFGISFHYE